LSVRVDVLPPTVTAVLADLRDRVPAEPNARIIPIIEAAWQAPISQLLSEFDATPVAAASLGQVYRGVRHDGRVVAIKVLRPQIHRIIETDLAALHAIVRLIKDYPLIRNRAHLERLYAEFAAILRQELDYRHEAENNVRLARLLRDQPRIALPVIHYDLSNATVLVMDWVAGIAPDQSAALDAAQVPRAQVAQVLLESFFQQCFVAGTFHADPHPGNMLIVPGDGSDWRIVLLDLGAVASVPVPLQQQLRAGVLAVVGNDVPGVVHNLDAMGMLLPNADRQEVARVLGLMLAQVTSRRMSEMRTIDVRGMASEAQNLLLTLPFQMPQDVIYLGRTLGLLSGVVTMLDPHINLIDASRPLAQRWVTQTQATLVDDLLGTLRTIIGLPRRLDRIMTQIEQGRTSTDMAQITAQLEIMQRQQRRRDVLIIALLGLIAYVLWHG
ncbi:MAG: ABC1 kinase family protein, partial [Roseiflexaceae bacterium]